MWRVLIGAKKKKDPEQMEKENPGATS